MTHHHVTLFSIIMRFFPNGTHGNGDSDNVPHWPPDLFAFCAKVVESCDSYTDMVREGSPLFEMSSAESRDSLVDIGNRWAATGSTDVVKDSIPELQLMWNIIIENQHCDISEWRTSLWVVAVHRLLVVADEACVGIGFNSKKNNWIQESFRLRYVERQNNALDTYQPVSCCIRVPSDVACVQPKTRTPQVGCTVRSLSHHLALLPPSTSIKVSWYPAESLTATESILDQDTFNILVIPFPYEIAAAAINGKVNARGTAYFDFDLSWITDKEKETVEYFARLIKIAKNDAGEINGIILPELALNQKGYELLVEKLKQLEFDGLQFLISGVKPDKEKRNSARTTFFADRSDGERLDFHGIQYKHHRWRLDRSQISSYSLGSRLNQEKIWWEDIDIGDRSLDFYVFRRGSCFSTLICEDLARVDPCQPVLRAVGPNLVIALLMDGPQLKERWSGRYAMGLADDPGSSVLSFTSTALMRRSAHKFGGRDIVGLWRDPYGETLELELTPGSGALSISLARTEEEEYTLDGRGDGSAAYAWRISGTLPIFDKLDAE